MNQKKNPFPLGEVISAVLYLGVCACCGVVLGEMNNQIGESWSLPQRLLALGLGMLGFIGLLMLQVILHEAGHMVCGLLTGYQFSSFRVGSIMVLNQDGHLQLRKLTIAGTGGQCLMVPPELVDGKMPYVLYNLGGPLGNFLTSGVTFCLYWIFRDVPVVSHVLLMATMLGVMLGLVNGIPLRMSGMDNDGRNAISLGKDPAALRAFWVQMQGNALAARGVRVKDMPDEWFSMPDDEAIKNPMIAALGVLCCNRMMDCHDFSGAKGEIVRLLALDTGIAGIHRGLMKCDLAYCHVLDGQEEQARSLLDKGQEKLMKAMKDFPSVIRTRYALADQAEREKILAHFEKVAKTYPYPCDIESERELMALLKGETEHAD